MLVQVITALLIDLKYYNKSLKIQKRNNKFNNFQNTKWKINVYPVMINDVLKRTNEAVIFKRFNF